jgi:hypothetical protein
MKMYRTLNIVVVGAVFFMACGPKVNVGSSIILDQDDDRPNLEEEERARILEENPDLAYEELKKKEKKPRQKNMVSRTELNQVLDGGVGKFLSNVEVTPHLDVGQKFIGWQIVRLKLSGVDLRPGDIVLAVNNKQIERPNQVQRIWEELRDSNAILVSAERAGKPFEVRIDVVQDQEDLGMP